MKLCCGILTLGLAPESSLAPRVEGATRRTGVCSTPRCERAVGAPPRTGSRPGLSLGWPVRLRRPRSPPLGCGSGGRPAGGRTAGAAVWLSQDRRRPRPSRVRDRRGRRILPSPRHLLLSEPPGCQGDHCRQSPGSGPGRAAW